MCRRAGFVYQYVEGFFGQDLQGGITISTDNINNNEILTVTNGSCQDFFEFREVLKMSTMMLIRVQSIIIVCINGVKFI